MKIRKTNGKIEMEFTKDEFIRHAVICNTSLPDTSQYDIDEISLLPDDKLIINEDMLDEYEDGFIMWSDDFWETFTEFCGYIDPDEFEGEIEVTLK